MRLLTSWLTTTGVRGLASTGDGFVDIMFEDSNGVRPQVHLNDGSGRRFESIGMSNSLTSKICPTNSNNLGADYPFPGFALIECASHS